MLQRFKLFLLFGFFATPAFALDTINVMADNSLSVAVTQLARNYARDKNVIVNTSFVAPSVQQAQISEGVAADVLITPQSAMIDALKTQGLVDVYSQILLAKDKLVLAGPADSSMEVDLSKGFPSSMLIWQMGGEPGFVVGNPQNLPEGAYGKEALRNMDAAEDLEPYTLYVKRRDQMIEMLSTKDYGVLFNSDVAGNAAIRVFDNFPENTYQPVQYYAVVLAGENMAPARTFLEYLKTDQAKKVLRSNGFSAD